MAEDKILLEYVETLKEENKDLKDRLKKRKPLFNMNGEWIYSIWRDIYNSEGWTAFVVMLTIATFIFSCFISWAVFVPDSPSVPEPEPIFTNNYYIAKSYKRDCVFIYREVKRQRDITVSKCIGDMNEAIKLRNSMLQLPDHKEPVNGQ